MLLKNEELNFLVPGKKEAFCFDPFCFCCWHCYFVPSFVLEIFFELVMLMVTWSIKLFQFWVLDLSKKKNIGCFNSYI
jgi:hypothetical protein